MDATPPTLGKRCTLNPALQGGGAHGAFTWGVLDRLLEEPLLDFEGISATSSGAMNALALAQGSLERCRERARHEIAAHRAHRPGESLDAYSAKTRLNTRLGFLRNLRDIGRGRAQSWLDRHASIS